MIEKPKKGQEFSNYSILGRVLLTPEIYDILARTKPGAGGEIQLTDAMAEYARNYGGMTAVEFTGKHYDMGNKLKVAEAQVELALQQGVLQDSLSFIGQKTVPLMHVSTMQKGRCFVYRLFRREVFSNFRPGLPEAL